MGNCGTKPETNEGEAPAPAPAPEEMVVESREVVAGEEEKETKVINEEPSAEPPSSLGQLINEAEEKVKEEAKESTETTSTEVEVKEVVATLSNTGETTQVVEEAVVVVEEKKINKEEENK